MNSVYFLTRFLIFSFISVAIHTKDGLIEEKKNLSTYILKDTNDTLLGELLYIHLASSNVTLMTKNRDKKNAYFSISVLWFTSNHNISSFDGVFFGVGLTQNYTNGSTFTDFSLCVLKNMLYRCDDCSMYDETNLNISESLKRSFDPILDVENGGRDDLLGYDIYDPITSNISPYNVLIKFSVNKPYFATEVNDLSYDITHNLTLFYGNFSNNEEGYRVYEVLEATTKNLTIIFSDYGRMSYNLPFIIITFLLYLI